MKHLPVLLAVLLAIGGPAAGLTDAERDTRFAACFDFASLVEGGAVNPHWLENGHFWFVSGEDTLLVDPDSGAMTPHSVAANPPPEPARPWRAEIRDENLWFFATTGTDSVQVTTTGSAEQPWDTWGATWSPDSRFYAVQQYDLTGTLGPAAGQDLRVSAAGVPQVRRAHADHRVRTGPAGDRANGIAMRSRLRR